MRTRTRTRHLGPISLAILLGSAIGPRAEGSCELECEHLLTPWWNCFQLTHECASSWQSESCIDGICGFWDAIGACIPGPTSRVLLNCDDGNQYPVPLADGAPGSPGPCTEKTPIEWAVFEAGERVGASSAAFGERADAKLLAHSLNEDRSERPDLTARNVVLSGRGGLTKGVRHEWDKSRRFPHPGYLVATFAVDARGWVIEGSGRVHDTSYPSTVRDEALDHLLGGLRFATPASLDDDLDGWALMQIDAEGYAILTMRY